ncbi:heme/hemin ABC transporter substrate-binding protein [Roseivivax sediminis]|uniref:Iron complex transport system substrate-binding protein n=1 Tax=Roseivivax sediminis TaxID=936889 RepID=A0A1I2D250_9RHOB|nr:ABC transporter substrate-binding protein [Roseivivax sediminis]SFE74596.1 iron complex transport system substrate-binding protein [Roseivivax sediminis]
MFRTRKTRGTDGRLVAILSLMTAGIATAFAWAVATLPMANAAEGESRVLSLGGAVTEIVYALGEGDRLVGRDSTSTWPPDATELPDVGYVRALSPEGVLSVSPDLILAEEGAGPPEAVEVLRAANVEFVTVPGGFDAEAVLTKIETVGAALGRPDRAAELAERTRTALRDASERAAAHDGPARRVLFVMSAEGGRLMAAGVGTAADGIIRMAGAENAMRGFQGYKQVSDEAVAAAAPEAVLMMDRGGEHAVSDETLFGSPALRTTPAARDGRVIRMDGLKLLGFGPRTAEVAAELSTALYGD